MSQFYPIPHLRQKKHLYQMKASLPLDSPLKVKELNKTAPLQKSLSYKFQTLLQYTFDKKRQFSHRPTMIMSATLPFSLLFLVFF
ncbi:hypothetical protein AB986_13590 [Alkalihalobacillus macyae]|uniref:Uncharacterized protein n=1 Tax=Guptibacillus hwajinpoensis TaxID=208199 RepID=A0A0J6CY17_9BACL|nr:hypothetical protein AB986_13590 [Alkalihalobacillus macyae]